MTLRAVTANDSQWIKQVFSSTNQEPKEGLLGFIAEEEKRKIGLITYVIASDLSSEASAKLEAKQSRNNRQSSIVNGQYSTCEIISLNSLTPGKGIGTALLEKVEEEAKENGCQKITAESNEITNDFFLKKGFIFKEGKLEIVLV